MLFPHREREWNNESVPCPWEIVKEIWNPPCVIEVRNNVGPRHKDDCKLREKNARNCTTLMDLNTITHEEAI